MVEGLFGKVAKQFTKRFRAMQHVAIHQPVYLGQVLLPFRNVYSCNVHCHVG